MIVHGHADPAGGAAAPADSVAAVPARMVLQREFHHGAGIAWQNMAVAWTLDRAVDTRALEAALAAVCARHELFRCWFERVDGEVVQLIGDPPAIPLRRLAARPAAAADPVGAATAPLLLEPFDLRRAPLCRLALVHDDAGERTLVLIVPHAIWDATSSALFERELQAELDGEAVAPPPLEAGDFAAWEQTAGSAERRAWWRERMADRPPPLPLPLIGRDREGDYRPAASRFAYDAEVLRRLATAARGARTTLAIALLSSFVAVLARNTGERELVVGVTHSNRDRPELGATLGFLIGVRLIRVAVDPGASFATLMGTVHRAVAEAGAHDLPVEAQVDASDPVVARAPFADVLFNVIPHVGGAVVGTASLRRRQLVPWSVWRPTAACPWGCQFDIGVGERPDGSAWAIVVHNERTLERDQAGRLGAQLIACAERAGVAPETPVEQLVTAVDWRTVKARQRSSSEAERVEIQ